MGTFSNTIKRERVTAATATRRFDLPPAQAEKIMEGKMEKLTVDQLLRILSQEGATISMEADAMEE